MKQLLMDSTGYIGKRLLLVLIKLGHEFVCCVRDVKRFNPIEALGECTALFKLDLPGNRPLNSILKDLDAVYFPLHSISSSEDYQSLRENSVGNYNNTCNVKSLPLLLTKIKLPREARLEFKIIHNKATQPFGFACKLFWYAVLPIHEFIFSGMSDHIISTQKPNCSR